MNALELLSEQHRQIADLFSELLSCDVDDRPECFTRLANALTQHAILESTHLYPALQRHGAENEVNDALKAHEEVKYELENVCRVEQGVDGFRSCVSSLQGKLDAHVREEETYLFALARTHLGDAALVELGEAMRRTMRLWEEYQPSEETNPVTPWRSDAHAGQ
jgi:hypothetical protein